MLISTHLRLIDSLQASIAELEKRIEEDLRPFAKAVERRQTIPGRPSSPGSAST